MKFFLCVNCVGFGVLIDNGADQNVYFLGVKFSVSRISVEFKWDATFRNKIMEGFAKFTNKVCSPPGPVPTP